MIFHGLFFYNGIHPVTIKCSGTCGIIFCPRIFYGKNRPAVKYQNVIHLSGVDGTILVWYSVVTTHFVLLIDHVFDMCQIGYNYIPTSVVFFSDFGHCNIRQFNVMEYDVPRHVVIYKVSGGCCCCCHDK